MARSKLQIAIDELQALAARQDEAIFVYPAGGDDRSYRLTGIEPYLDLLILTYESAGVVYTVDAPKRQDFSFSKPRLELHMIDCDGEGLLLVAE